MATSKLGAVLVAGAMLFTSTAAAASNGSAPVRANPWALLAGMTGGAPTVAMCTGAAVAATAAAQAAASGCVLPVTDQPVASTVAVPPPMAVPPVETAGPGIGLSPMLIGLAALALGAVLFFALRNNDDNDSAVSPG